MKLLLDQNLSRRLLEALGKIWPGSTHVAMVGLAQASDKKIWQYAAEHGYCLLSKDNDFLNMAAFYGAPPKTIIIDVGNVSTDDVLHCLLSHRNDIEMFSSNLDETILVIP